MWVKTGLDCGFDSAPTLDEVMLSILEHQPQWSIYADNYNAEIARRAYIGGGLYPYGFASGPLYWPNSPMSPDCYEWNDRKWKGSAPTSPAWTECGKDICTECDSFESA